MNNALVNNQKANLSQMVWLVLFAMILLDSFFQYFIVHRIGFLLPVNAMLLPVIGASIVLMRNGGFKFDGKMAAWIIIGSIGYTLGMLVDDRLGFMYLGSIITAIGAFVIGYNVVGSANQNKRVVKLACVIALMYVAVCTIALSRKVPSLFPVIDALHYIRGELVRRPEVTTDQNFQIYYLFPFALLLFFPLKLLRIPVILIALACGLYTLNHLQTRSGFLVLLGVSALAFTVPVWYQQRKITTLIVIPVIMLFGLILKLDSIINILEQMINRFTRSDFHTLSYRLHAAGFLVKNLFNPSAWFPIGEHSYADATGDLPHFTPTAAFLAGGILSLFSWVAMFLIPTIKASYLVISRKIDLYSAAIVVACITSTIISFSLSAALREQVWLWGGAVVAIINLHKQQVIEQYQQNDSLETVVEETY